MSGGDLFRGVDDLRSALERSRCLPRTTLVAAVGALVVHAVAALRGVATTSTSSSDWLALAGADLVLVVVAVVRPGRFLLRTFALPGVLAVSTAVIILIPLPWLVRTYDAFLPDATIGSIALGTAVMWAALGLTPLSMSGRSRAADTARRSLPLFVPGIVLAAIVVLPVWLLRIPEIPFLRLVVGGNGRSTAELRQAALRDLDPAALRLAVSLLRNIYLTFAVAWFAADWAVHRSTSSRRANRSLAALLVTAAVAGVYSLVTTERAIVGQVVLAGAVAVLIATGRRLTARLTVTLVGIGLAFPVVFGTLVTSGSPMERLSQATAGLRRRIFYLPADVMTHYFTAFPAQRDFLGGASVPKLGRLVEGGSVNLPGYIYDLYYRRSAISGNANASFIGAGWANFGTAGVVIWCLLAGVSVVALEGFVRRRPTRTHAALRGLFVVQVALLTQADLFRSVLSFAPGVLDVALIAWAAERLLPRHRPVRSTLRPVVP